MATNTTARKTRVSCDQCSALMINGVFCHEIGCPNQKARWDADSESWVKQRKCFDCGCDVDTDDPCCSAPCDDNDAEEEEQTEPAPCSDYEGHVKPWGKCLNCGFQYSEHAEGQNDE